MIMMPKLQPYPIKTQKYSLFIKLWKLIAKKRQWQLIDDWHYVLPNNRKIVIPKGFVFDGSSYPWIVWLFFSPTGLLLIPVILHDFCFKYDYLWAIHDDKIYKFKHHFGFLNWCALIRRVGIERNELQIIDYSVWLMTVMFGWITWFQNRRKVFPDIFPNVNKKD